MAAFWGFRVIRTVGVAVFLPDRPFAVTSISCDLAHLFAILHVVFAVNDQPIFIIINVANVCLSDSPTAATLLFLLTSVILPVVFEFYELVLWLYLVKRLLYNHKPCNLDQFRQYRRIRVHSFPTHLFNTQHGQTANEYAVVIVVDVALVQ